MTALVTELRIHALHRTGCDVYDSYSETEDDDGIQRAG